MASARTTCSGRLPALAAVLAGLHVATAEAAAPQRPFLQQLTYAAGSLTATADGVTYNAQGSANLPDFNQPVQDGGASDTAPAGSGWPSLAGSDWAYHTFYLTRTSLPASRGFLRVTVSTPAP